MNKKLKVIKGGKGIPDNYCIKAKDFISDKGCKELNLGRKIMNIYLADIKGKVGNISSDWEYNNLGIWLNKYGREISKKFVEQGYTEFPMQLAQEIELAIPYSEEYLDDKDFKKVLDKFIRMLNRCKGIAIASKKE